MSDSGRSSGECRHGWPRRHGFVCDKCEVDRLTARVAELEAALDQRAQPLRWTRELPRQVRDDTAWYWWRPSMSQPAEVVLVDREHYAGHWRWVHFIGNSSPRTDYDMKGWWAGPITPPADEVLREPVGPAVFGCYPEGTR